MFDKEFFPTPESVCDLMGLHPFEKVIFEPSAGKGDIVDYLLKHGAKEVIAAEKVGDLRAILATKCQVIGHDFFKVTSEQISHVHQIVMNPPFSNAHRHILHAWEIAPEGCEITSLCNWTTCQKHDSQYGKSELETLIHHYGTATNLGDCFKNAERKTGVEVGLVKLFKPALSSSFDFDGFFYEEEAASTQSGLMPYNEVRAIVNSYVGAVRLFDKIEEIQEEMRMYTGVTGFGKGLSFTVGYEQTVTTKADFSKAMQKHCWKVVFDKLNVKKYVTKGVMDDINKFIESQQNYPFTMRNIYRMIEIIVGTWENTMNKAIIEAVDKFTRHTHENRYNVEGWKTNGEGYYLTEKFITGWISEPNWSKGLGIKSWNGNFEYILDLTKALCYITGTDYNSIPEIGLTSCPRDERGEIKRETLRDGKWEGRPQNENQFDPNTWYEWGFFEFKVFKKGTGHFKFKDKNVWEGLNLAYGKAKGFPLPEKVKERKEWGPKTKTPSNTPTRKPTVLASFKIKAA